MKIKEWLLIPIFILIIFISGAIIHLDLFPTLLSPKINLANKKLGLEDPLIVRFDRKVIKHKIESSFNLNPKTVGKMEWQGNDLIFQPIGPWKPDSNFEISFAGITQIAYGFNFKDSFSTDSLPEIVESSPASDSLIHPKTAIEIKLNKGGSNYRLDFKITPQFAYDLNIDEERKKFKIVPKEGLAQNTRYQFIAYSSYQDSQNKDWYTREAINFQFQTISPPDLDKIVPNDKEDDVKEFTPVKAYFSKPMKEGDESKFFEISPNVAGSFGWEDGKKTLVFKPKKWMANTNYILKIKPGWQAEDDTYLEKEIVSTFHSYNSSGTLNQISASTEEPKIKEGRFIDINLAKQILSVFEDGLNRGNFKISSGKRGMNTPTGTFGILNKRKRAWSNKYKLFMPYWMQFTGQGHGIHELPEWPSGYKEGANHLGIPVSHGCVRLGVGSAETVYHFVEVGTPVHIHY